MSKVIFLTIFVFSVANVSSAQENIAQQVYAIFQQNCLGCHGKGGAFTEELIMEYPELINSGAVIQGDPEASELYKRLLGNTDRGQQMPLGQPPLTPAAINTIHRWIAEGAPDWETQHDINFISPTAMLNSIKTHLEALNPFDRVFARYFTLTHLHNAGETPETLHAYQTAFSKLANSLSWEAEIHNPQPIGNHHIFYIDLRDYGWDVTEAWTHIEAVYPYPYGFGLPVYETLQQLTDSNVPYVYMDWFIANAARPPLYHDILDLPDTDSQLERRLEVDVVENLFNAPGERVWRAGFNKSGVSNHNRVVERHLSKYGAYWKSYDFAGSASIQNIFTHPLNFRHDGGEIVFNLPNGLQGYYLADANGERLDAAPIDIVSDPKADDPTVRNGISCIGCHTEGMKTFEDTVRAAIEQNPNPLFDKGHALSLYIEQAVMDTFVQEDTDRYRTALEKTGAGFGGVEPVHRFHEAFFSPLTAHHAAAAVGLETQTFLEYIQEKPRLQNLGLSSLATPNGTIKRDAWTQHFAEIVFTINDTETILTTGIYSYIQDSHLRAAIKKELGKDNLSTLTPEDMQQLKFLYLQDLGIRSLSGLEAAINLVELNIDRNPISSIGPLANLTNLRLFSATGAGIFDLTPLANLTKLETLDLKENKISDISPVAALIQLKRLFLGGNKISDVSPIANLTQLKWGDLRRNDISDFSPLDTLLQSTSIILFKNPGFPSGGPKIEKPLLWVTVPAEKDLWGFPKLAVSQKDLLSAASSNLVTEIEISTNGATEGESVGNNVWRVGELDGDAIGNINTMLRDNGINPPDIPDYAIYLCYTFYSTSEQNTKLFLGSDFESKTWLNGTLINKNAGYYGHPDYQTFLPITLKQGKNVLLIAVANNEGDAWGIYFGFAPDTEYTTIPPYDVNRDGQINILDLVLVADAFGKNTTQTDINGDGVVNILDLVMIANEM
ncbi:MAG: leucine-rich repeat domain-containing protein [Candidatus Poribacteria bacterium]|nr:leucine-rich repeat domain-containing protein [Candidatus Poribacteria bacterium]